MVKKTKKKEIPKRKVCDICIEYISGQSMTPFDCFEARYFYPDDKDTIAQIISSVVNPNFRGEVEEDVYVECLDEQLKLNIFSAILKKNKSFGLSSEKIGCGSGWGLNVFVAIKDIEVKSEYEKYGSSD